MFKRAFEGTRLTVVDTTPSVFLHPRQSHFQMLEDPFRYQTDDCHYQAPVTRIDHVFAAGHSTMTKLAISDGFTVNADGNTKLSVIFVLTNPGITVTT